MQELRSGRGIVLVDVRSRSEFRGGHIGDSWLLPLHELAARACELEMHRWDPIVVVSGNGDRAAIASRTLRLMHFDEVSVLAGGLEMWRSLGFPIEVISNPRSIV